MKKVVYTCITGAYDKLCKHKYKNNDWDYVCFTDNIFLLFLKHYKGWQIKPLQYKDSDATRNNRWHKLHPHVLFPEYELSVYVDANIIIKTNKLFVDIDNLQKDVCLAMCVHPSRKCIYEEAEACIEQNKEDPIIIQNQIKFYKSENFPQNYGLTENCIIYRKHNDITCIKLMEEWWNMLMRFSKRDQLSFMYVIWKYDAKEYYSCFEPYRHDRINFKFQKHKR